MNEKLVSMFIEKAESAAAEVARVKNSDQAYDTVIEIIKDAGAGTVGSSPAPSPALSALFEKNKISCVSTCSPEEAAELDLGIIHGDAGIAETGTVAHDAADLFIRYFSMLCPVNIVLLNTNRVLETMDDEIRALKTGDSEPRYATFITGPSRTADIERVLTIGVHGPGRLWIILIDEGGC